MSATEPVIAVLNAGSSSIKLSLFSADGPRGQPQPALLLHAVLEGIGQHPRLVAQHAGGAPLADRRFAAGQSMDHDQALLALLHFVRETLPHLELWAIGHRVVHGGLAHARPARVTAALLGELALLSPLAPLHQPHNLAPMRMALAHLPQLPQVACFDTAFHRGQPELAQMFALPHALHEAGVRRYGFHGLSYEYVAGRLPSLLPQAAARARVVVLHLGNGASACALADGRSVATSMGLTAADGLPMGTRCGALDPGVLLYLMAQHGMDHAALERLVYQQSGLLGVSGVASDMRELLASDDPRAHTAIALFVYRIQREIGALAAVLGGLDALVFTAGIGENAAEVRRRVVDGLGWLGVALDDAANDAPPPPQHRAAGWRISTAASRCSAWVLPTDEEAMIARHTRAMLAGHPGVPWPGPSSAA